MSIEAATKLARSLMFEGYVLYPYRQSSLKNQKRLIFGSLYPAAWAETTGERQGVTATGLLRGASVQLRVLFLHWARRTEAATPAWLEAQERSVSLGTFSLAAVAEAPAVRSFALPSAQWSRADAHYRQETVSGLVRVSARRVERDVFELSCSLSNQSSMRALPGTDERDLAERLSFGGAHLLLYTEDGRFESLLEPSDALAAAAGACRNDGVWPVLVGSAEARNTLLASPITLYDFPVVAPESPGDYCDSTEIDEMLALRVRTLTDAEKAQARSTDPRARQILDRSEGLTDEQLLGLHGAWREPSRAPGGPLPGARVRLRPKPGRDVLDLALAGELATVISLEQDLEGRQYCTVTVDADPGRDLGALGQPGHRFFFELEEVELVP